MASDADGGCTWTSARRCLTTTCSVSWRAPRLAETIALPFARDTITAEATTSAMPEFDEDHASDAPAIAVPPVSLTAPLADAVSLNASRVSDTVIATEAGS